MGDEPCDRGPGGVRTTVRQQMRPAGARGAATQASLVVLSGWEIGREFPLHGPRLIVGRAPGVDLEIPEPEVSRLHARVRHERIDQRDYYEIADLGSSNGVFVNDARVEHAPLVDGDRVQVGPVLLKFVVRDEVEAAFFDEVHRRIHYDQLTGLLTSESILRALAAEVERAPAVLTVAMTDLDGLKRVNDTHGHLAGRRLIQEMGVMLREVLRQGDLAGLYGGDEALVLFRNAALGEALEVAERLRATVEGREVRVGEAVCSVTISQGLAEWPRHARTPEELVAAADRALYAAKAAGRNCIRCADR